MCTDKALSDLKQGLRVYYIFFYQYLIQDLDSKEDLLIQISMSETWMMILVIVMVYLDNTIITSREVNRIQKVVLIGFNF